MDLKAKIKHYLGGGTPPSQVATIVGCSPSYVSQLLSQPEFKAEVEAMLVDSGKDLEEDERLGNRMEAFEHLAIGSLSRDLEQATFMERVKALDTVSRIRHDRAVRKNPGAFVAPTVQIVNVQLPAHQIPQLIAPIEEVQRNTKNEIVAIGSRNLASMPSEGVTQLFQSLDARKKSAAAVEQELFPAIAKQA